MPRIYFHGVKQAIQRNIKIFVYFKNIFLKQWKNFIPYRKNAPGVDEINPVGNNAGTIASRSYSIHDLKHAQSSFKVFENVYSD